MWEIIRERTGIADDLQRPGTDDEFDAAIGYVLGSLLLSEQASVSRQCAILGNGRDGAFLVPYEQKLIAAWDGWHPVP